MKRRDLLALGLVVALAPALLPIVRAVHHATYSTLGRDQGIFQYVAWALGQGDVDYRDVRDVNGPLIHLVHRLFLALGGRDEVRFHELDFAISIAAFFSAGALLPRIAGYRSGDGKRGRGEESIFVSRIALGAVATLVLLGQYVKYIFWDLAQRESFCDWFLLPGALLAVVAVTPRTSSRSAELAAWGAGLLLVCACFGKHTYALFLVISFFGLLFSPRERLLRVLGHFVLGGLVGAASFLFYLAFFGDVSAFATIYFRDAPRIYRFIWHRPPSDMFGLAWGENQHLLGAATFALGVILMALRVIHPRVLPILALPLVGYGSVVLQGKGFPYHFHPISSGLALAWLTLLAGLLDEVGEEEEPAARPTSFARSLRGGALALGLAGAAVGLSMRTSERARTSSYYPARWLPELGEASHRETREFYDRFRLHDFFPWEMREVATFLREKTRADERVEAYGMDPYLLFLAERRSATRFIYAYDLNYDTAIAGANEMLDQEAAAARTAWISALRDVHEREALADLRAHAVGAFVFFDVAPLLSETDAAKDFVEHNPTLGAYLAENFRRARSFGQIHVYLPKDRVLVEPSKEEAP